MTLKKVKRNRTRSIFGIVKSFDKYTDFNYNK